MPDVFPLVHEQHPWFMVALGGLFLLALVASRFARRWPEGLSRKLTLRLGLATVAAVVGWFIDPVLAAGVSSFFVPPFFDDLSLVRVAVLFLAEVIGIAVAGRLVLQVTEGRAFAMAAAMVLGNLLSGSYEEELPHAYLVLTFALPLMAAFLMSGWDRDFRFGRVVGEAHTTAASGEAGHRCISRKKPSGWVEWLGLSSAAALASSWGTYGVLITALSLSYEPSRYGWLVWLGLPGLLSVFLGTRIGRWQRVSARSARIAMWLGCAGLFLFVTRQVIFLIKFPQRVFVENEWTFFYLIPFLTAPLGVYLGTRRDVEPRERPPSLNPNRVGLGIRCFVALSVTVAVLPVYYILMTILGVFPHRPQTTLWFWVAIIAWLAFVPGGIVVAARKIRPSARGISSIALSVAAFFVPFGIVFLADALWALGDSLGLFRLNMAFPSLLALVFAGFLAATFWQPRPRQPPGPRGALSIRPDDLV